MTRTSFLSILIGGTGGLLAGNPATEAIAGLETTTATPEAVATPYARSHTIDFYYPESLSAHSDPVLLDLTTHGDPPGTEQWKVYRHNMEFDFECHLSNGGDEDRVILEKCMGAVQDSQEHGFVFHFAGGSVVHFRGILKAVSTEARVDGRRILKGHVIVLSKAFMG